MIVYRVYMDSQVYNNHAGVRYGVYPGAGAVLVDVGAGAVSFSPCGAENPSRVLSRLICS